MFFNNSAGSRKAVRKGNTTTLVAINAKPVVF